MKLLRVSVLQSEFWLVMKVLFYGFCLLTFFCQGSTKRVKVSQKQFFSLKHPPSWHLNCITVFVLNMTVWVHILEGLLVLLSDLKEIFYYEFYWSTFNLYCVLVSTE